MKVTLYDHWDQTPGSMAVEVYKDIENVVQLGLNGIGFIFKVYFY